MAVNLVRENTDRPLVPPVVQSLLTGHRPLHWPLARHIRSLANEELASRAKGFGIPRDGRSVNDDDVDTRVGRNPRVGVIGRDVDPFGSSTRNSPRPVKVGKTVTRPRARFKQKPHYGTRKNWVHVAVEAMGLHR